MAVFPQYNQLFRHYAFQSCVTIATIFTAPCLWWCVLADFSFRKPDLQRPLLLRNADQHEQGSVNTGKDQGRVPGSEKCREGQYFEGHREVVGMFEIGRVRISPVTSDRK